MCGTSHQQRISPGLNGVLRHTEANFKAIQLQRQTSTAKKSAECQLNPTEKICTRGDPDVNLVKTPQKPTPIEVGLESEGNP